MKTQLAVCSKCGDGICKCKIRDWTARIIATLVLSLFAVSTVFGQETVPITPANVSPELKAAFLSFYQDVSAAKTVTLALYPTYSPSITTASKWGYGAALICPVSAISALESNSIAQHTFGGLRFDSLGSQFFASTVAVGAKGDFQIYGHNFTLFAESGANIPLSGAGNNNKALGAMVGSGVDTRLFTFGKNKQGSLDFFVCAEKWTLFPGYVLHGGPTITFGF